MISQCIFDGMFLMINDVEHSSMYLATCLPLKKNDYPDSLSIFKSDWFFFFVLLLSFLLLNCMSCLYVVEINPSSDVWFANIVLHSAGWLFIFLIVSSVVQKLFGLI